MSVMTMAAVRRRLYDKNGNPRPPGWGIKLIYKVNGNRTNEAVHCTRDASGFFAADLGRDCQPAYPSITPQSYSPKIVCPCTSPTSPTHACRAASPQPWLGVDGYNYRDVIGQCDDVESGDGRSLDRQTLFLFDYVADDARRADPEALAADIAGIERAGYLGPHQDGPDPGEACPVFQVQSRTSSGPPALPVTGLLCYPWCLPDPMAEERDPEP